MLNTKKLLNKMLGNQYVVETVNASSFNVAGNATAQQNIDVSKSGYTPIGIVAINNENNGSSQNNLNIYSFSISNGTTARICYKNLTSTGATVKSQLRILYIVGGVVSRLLNAFATLFGRKGVAVC